MDRRDKSLLLTPAEQLVFNRFGIRIRFASAAAALLFVAFTKGTGLYPEFPSNPVILLTFFVLAYNTGGSLWLRGIERVGSTGHLSRLQHLLTLLDQVTLTVSLYLLGGLELFVLPVILLAMFMVAINTGKKESYWFLGTGLMFVGGFFVLQYAGMIAYRSAIPEKLLGLPAVATSPITSNWLSLASTWLILAGLLFGVIYFSNFIKDKYARVIQEILDGRQEITSLRKLSADVLDIFPFAVITVNAMSGRIEEANPAAMALLGAHLGWLGRRIHEVPELVSSGLAVYFERALGGDEIKVNDFPFIAQASRSKRFLSITIFVARKPDGSPDRILFCAEDITDRLRHEAEQRDLQQALLQTEKMASLGQMAAGVAHELNNPLTAIDAYAQLLLFKLKSGESIGPENLQRVERIMENSDRIRNLVKNLLSYARPSPETSLPLNVNAVIEESLVFCEHDLRKRSIAVVKRLSEALPRIHGNKTQLQQVFVNLITNAIHAVGESGGEIVLETTGQAENVRVAVSDNGCGIQRQDLDRIFEPFFSTKEVGEGTGLGLPIVLTILEKHNGSIQVTSEPGRGTTFQIAFPPSENEPVL
jgi:signal transduction histidine kinase